MLYFIQSNYSKLTYIYKYTLLILFIPKIISLINKILKRKSTKDFTVINIVDFQFHFWHHIYDVLIFILFLDSKRNEERILLTILLCIRL